MGSTVLGLAIVVLVLAAEQEMRSCCVVGRGGYSPLRCPELPLPLNLNLIQSLLEQTVDGRAVRENGMMEVLLAWKGQESQELMVQEQRQRRG